MKSFEPRLEPREQLAKLIAENGESYTGLARLLGRNAAYVQQFIKRGVPRKLSEDDRKTLARYFNVGEALLGGPERFEEPPLVEVPAYAVRASAGPGAVAGMETRASPFGFEARWLKRLTPSRPDHLSIITVMGDSMEPTLSDGDDVLVDTSDTVARLRDGIYVLRQDDTIFVKRVAIGPKRRIDIVSDNAAYPRWEAVDASDLTFIGRVLWSGRTHR
jgi:phage repressor protein C with HTH and peptisase S24 domain